MTCEDSNYYPMNYYSTNYYPGYYPDSMMRSSAAQQPVGGLPTMMPAGAQPTGFPYAFWTLVCRPDGPVGRCEARIIYRKYNTLQQR